MRKNGINEIIIIICCFFIGAIIGLTIHRCTKETTNITTTTSPVEKVEIDSIMLDNSKLIIEVDSLNNIKNAKIVEIKSLDNDSTLMLFYELIRE